MVLWAIFIMVGKRHYEGDSERPWKRHKAFHSVLGKGWLSSRHPYPRKRQRTKVPVSRAEDVLRRAMRRRALPLRAAGLARAYRNKQAALRILRSRQVLVGAVRRWRMRRRLRGYVRASRNRRRAQLIRAQAYQRKLMAERYRRYGKK